MWFLFRPTSVISDSSVLPVRKHKSRHSCDLFIGPNGIWVLIHASGLHNNTYWSDGSLVCVFGLFWEHSDRFSLKVKHGIGRREAGLKSAWTPQDRVCGQKAKHDTVLFTIRSFDALSSEGLVIAIFFLPSGCVWWARSCLPTCLWELTLTLSTKARLIEGELLGFCVAESRWNSCSFNLSRLDC